MAIGKIYLRLTLLLTLLVSLAACERRPLVDPSERVRVRVVINTDSIPNITCGIYNPNIAVPQISPDIVRVIFFKPGDGEMVSQSYLFNKGRDKNGREYLEGFVNIDPGTYDMLCYNFDTPQTHIVGDNNWFDIKAYTNQISAQRFQRFAMRAGQVPYIYEEPDHVVVAREKNIVIPNISEMHTIVTEAKTVIDSYYIQIRLVNGQKATSAAAVLSDMSPANFLGENTRVNDYSAVYFDMTRSSDANSRKANKDVLCAVFNTFGKLPDQASHNEKSELFLSFYITTTKGQEIKMTLNMDSVFQTEDAQLRHWLLIDKEVVLPKDGGAFNPSSENWNEINGTIDI